MAFGGEKLLETVSIPFLLGLYNLGLLRCVMSVLLMKFVMFNCTSANRNTKA